MVRYGCPLRGQPPLTAAVGTREEMTPAEAQRMKEDEIGTRVIEAAIAVHRELGPGLLETGYEDRNHPLREWS